ncbi:MAG: DUF177 domain-containing protein [Actinomycetota bacterium]
MDITPEFSRPIRVDQISVKGTDVDIEADAAERAALARRFGLVDLPALSARVRLKPIGRDGLVRVQGNFSAEVVQACVVTLAPVPASLCEAFEVTFGPESAEGEGDDVEVSFHDEDPPDPIVGGAIDIGEVVAEQLALALDPFPRAEGAQFDQPAEEAEPEPERRPSPFAALAAFRQKKE